MNTAVYISPFGEEIIFQIYNYYDNWNDVGGIYMMCKFHILQNSWEPIYIGKASSLKHRLCLHEKWIPAFRLGATKVLAIVEPSEINRVSLECCLIQNLSPMLNKQLKPVSAVQVLLMAR
jgi:excinuclease UvrABC nuclease subunit